MKQIPIEKCLDHVSNIFELVLVGARRARQISYGGAPKLSTAKKEKPTIAALEEIVEGVTTNAILDEEMPVYKERNNLGFSTPEPLPPLSALSRLVQGNKEDTEDSDLRNLDDSELGLRPPTSQID